MAKSETEAPTPSSTKGVEEIARSYFEAVAARDVEGMIAHWRPGGVGRIHGIEDLRPPDDYRRWFGGLFAAFPNLVFEVLSITTEDERAAVRWRARGEFNGTSAFEGLEPNGESIDVQGIDLLTIRDGLLDEIDAYTNSVQMMRQLGALPEAGSRQERAMMGALNLRTRVQKRLSRRP